MKKKTLVLALSALATGSAFAQSNVQIYGVVDYGYTYRHDLTSAAENVNALGGITPNRKAKLMLGKILAIVWVLKVWKKSATA